MSGSLRYQHPVIVNHLATQYVLGVMDYRVRARMEQLILTTPELDRAVALLADQAGDVHYQLPEQTASDKLWKNIQKQLPNNASVSQTASKWWQQLWIWQAGSFVGLAASLVLAVLLVFTINNTVKPTGASYLATMSAHDATNDDIQFVISVYGKTRNSPSTLNVQWSKLHKPPKGSELHLWTEDRETGKRTYIGIEPAAGEKWALSKSQWKAITESKRLLMTKDNNEPEVGNIVFSGPCIQLKPWAKQKT